MERAPLPGHAAQPEQPTQQAGSSQSARPTQAEQTPPPSRLLPFPFSVQGRVRAGHLTPEQALRAVQGALGSVRDCSYTLTASTLDFVVARTERRHSAWGLLAGIPAGRYEAVCDGHGTEVRYRLPCAWGVWFVTCCWGALAALRAAGAPVLGLGPLTVAAWTTIAASAGLGRVRMRRLLGRALREEHQ